MSDIDRELDRLLRGMRDEELPESALKAARSGVRARIAAGKRRRMTWTWLSVAAVAAALWFAAIVIREPQLARLPVVALRIPAVPRAELQRGVTAGSKLRSTEGNRGPQHRGSGMLLAGSGGNPAAQRSPAPAGTRHARTAAPVAEQKTEDTRFIRMVTDDPDVVILWALNSKGETR